MLHFITDLQIKLDELADRGQTGDEGATMVEYGLMVALVAVVASVGAATLGGRVNTLFGGLTFP